LANFEETECPWVENIRNLHARLLKKTFSPATYQRQNERHISYSDPPTEDQLHPQILYHHSIFPNQNMLQKLWVAQILWVVQIQLLP
jgi:hypothetical protein